VLGSLLDIVHGLRCEGAADLRHVPPLRIDVLRRAALLGIDAEMLWDLGDWAAAGTAAESVTSAMRLSFGLRD
jgi:hypothetical protein